MSVTVLPARESDFVKQFSVFTPNQVGRLSDIVSALKEKDVHVLALNVLDATDSAIIRFVTDNPERTRELLQGEELAFTESDLTVVSFEAATELSRLLAALLESEVNVNYLYSFIPHPNGKALMALSLEDNEVAEKVLQQHRFGVLRQADISR